MVKLISAQKMSRAIDKARAAKPFVRVVAFRQYTVTNRETGAIYNVTFEVKQGERFAACTCKAGKSSQNCYHVAAAAGAHMMIAAAMAERDNHLADLYDPRD